MRIIYWEQTFKDDLKRLRKSNRKLGNKVLDLIIDTTEDPMYGEGKPEALKHDLKGLWSRRIDSKHRLIYKFDDVSVTFLACYGHYGDK